MITVKFEGIYAQKIAKKYRKGIKIKANTLLEVLSCLKQDSIFSDDIMELLQTYPTQFLLGRQRKHARSVTAEQASGRWQLAPGSAHRTLHIVPAVTGNEITTAMIITALITTAVSIGVNLLMSKLFPVESPSTGNKRKSALYENGLQTQKEGVPLAWIAGRDVWCGFNVIEADVDVTETGGATSYNRPGDGTTGASDGSGWPTGHDSYQDLAATLYGAGSGRSGSKSIDNNLYSTAVMRILGAVGAGHSRVLGSTYEQQQTNIYINDVPWRDAGTGQLTRFGINWQDRPGVLGQTAIPITPGIASNFNASQDLKKLSPGGSQVYVTNTVTSHDVHRVKARIRATLLDVDNKNGDQRNTTVVIRAEVKRASASSWIAAGYYPITGKTTDPIQRQMNIYAPPAGPIPEPWLFRIFRETPDSTNDKLENSTAFNGWVEIIDKELRYDGSEGGVATALTAYQIDLSEFDANSPPEIAERRAGRLCEAPLGYDPATGTWPDPWLGETEYVETDNNILILREMACDPDIGLGYEANSFNFFDLLPAAKYCDEMVNGHRRHTLNKQFTDEVDSWAHLTDIAQSCGAQLYDNGGQLIVVMDMPTGNARTYLNNSDVEGRSFSYNFVPLKERINECVVEYDDPEQRGKINTVVYRDETAIADLKRAGVPNGGRVSKRLAKTGCTNRAQAFWMARYWVYCAQHEPNTVSWKVGLRACRYMPGWIAEVDDERKVKSHRGRIRAVIDADHIELDKPVVRTAGEPYQLRASMDANRILRDLPLSTSSEPSAIIKLVGHGLEAGIPVGIAPTSDLAKQPSTWKIQGIQQTGAGVFTVTAKQHDERKYAYLDGTATTPPSEWPRTDFRLGKPVFRSVTATSSTDDVLGPIHNLNISWEPLGGQVRNYVVQIIGPSDNDWRTIYTGGDTFCRDVNVRAGTHHISLKGVNTFGASGEVASTIYELEYDETDTLLPPIFVEVD